MGKTGKWLKGFLTGKKEKEKDKCSEIINPGTAVVASPASTPREKRRWSFRRSSAAAAPHKDGVNSCEQASVNHPPQVQAILDCKDDQTKHAMAVAVAVDAAVAAARAAAAVIRLTVATTGRNSFTQEEEEAAATKIQSGYRAYLARQALSALRGIVKLQSLVRGHLVRKHASITLRCMQALVTTQARARAQRIRMSEEARTENYRHRRSIQDQKLLQQRYHDFDRAMEENIKIVEIDKCETKGNSKGRNSIEHRYSTHRASSKQETYQISPTASAITDMSPRTCSGYFEDYGLTTTQTCPQYSCSVVSKCDRSRASSPLPQPEYAESVMSYDYTLYPSYMANTQSSRAKARSQSAPKARPNSYERQPTKRRSSIEGRNVPRAVRMQRSSSHVGATAQGYQYPWSLKLDRSTVSLVGSECGSTSTMLTNNNYCRSLAT